MHVLYTFVSMERKKLFSQRTLPWLGKVEQTDRNIDRETEREILRHLLSSPNPSLRIISLEFLMKMALLIVTTGDAC